MQLSDILTLAATEGARRHLEKRAGVVLPLTIGAMLPGIAHSAVERARSTEKKLEDASVATKLSNFSMPSVPPGSVQHSPLQAMLGRLMSGAAGLGSGAAKSPVGEGFMGSLGAIAGAPGKGVANGVSDMVQKKLFGQDLGERKDPMGIAGGAALSSFGKEMGTTGANLLRDIANKAMDAVGHAGDNAARQAILVELKRTDPVLAQADDKLLMESYHTMTRFAPVLSTDKNAVRSFLRQAVMTGSGPDFMTIKHLADSERAVVGEKK